MSESPEPAPTAPETVSDRPASRPEPAAPPPPATQRNPLAVLGAAGFLLTAAALLYLWWHQQQLPVPSSVDPARVIALESELRSLQQRDGQLEQRLRALEQRPASAPVDLGPLQGRVAALEQRPAQAPATPDSRVDALTQRVSQNEAQIQAANERFARLQRVQLATVALDAGQKLGRIANAPPALARFADSPPPTLADLRLGFAEASRHAEAVSQSDPGNGTTWQRMWQRVQSLVTVREGNKVIVGSPAAPVLEEARAKLEAGDLAGSVMALDALDGAAKAAMADWRAQAQSLLDARAALMAMARG